MIQDPDSRILGSGCRIPDQVFGIKDPRPESTIEGPGSRSQIPDSTSRVLDPGSWDAGYWIQDPGARNPDRISGAQDPWPMVQDPDSRILGSGCRILGSGRCNANPLSYFDA